MPMARKVKEEAEKTHEMILKSAVLLFADKGYDKTTLNDIAESLNMTKGAIYWHFESKEKLLIELLDSALEHFRNDLDAVMPDGELTFVAVAKMMIKNACGMIGDRLGEAFFRLVHSGIKWSGGSMSHFREDFITRDKIGPKQAFEKSILNDCRAGRAKSEIAARADEISSIAMAIWDGLVKQKIDGFLSCDLGIALTHAYSAIWDNIRIAENTNGFAMADEGILN